MSTAAVAGYGGSVTGPTGAVEVKEWNINVTTEGLDSTSFDSAGWKEFVPGLIGADGSFTCLGTAVPARGLSTSVGTFLTGGGATISGSILINSVSVGTPVDGIVSHNCSFNFTGVITAT